LVRLAQGDWDEAQTMLQRVAQFRILQQFVGRGDRPDEHARLTCHTLRIDRMGDQAIGIIGHIQRGRLKPAKLRSRS